MKYLRNMFLYFEEAVAGTCLVVMTVFVFWNTFSRLIFKTSIPALDEISYTLFAYVIFVGSSSLYKRYGHGVIDLIVKLFPQKIQALLSIFTTALLLVTNVTLVILSSGYCISSWTRRTQTLHMPYSITSFSLVLAFAFMTIHSVFLLKNVIRKKDYYHKIPIYKGIFVVDSVEDMVQDSTETRFSRKEGEKT